MYPHLKVTFPSGEQNPDVLGVCGEALRDVGERPTLVSFMRGGAPWYAPCPCGKIPSREGYCCETMVSVYERGGSVVRALTEL